MVRVMGAGTSAALFLLVVASSAAVAADDVLIAVHGFLDKHCFTCLDADAN